MPLMWRDKQEDMLCLLVLIRLFKIRANKVGRQMFKSQLQKTKVLAYLTWFCAKLSLYPTHNL